ncbi:leucine-rich repeat protein, partial [Streptomyces scabiei]
MKISTLFLSAIVLLAFTFTANSQTAYTLKNNDVTVIKGVLTSTTLTDATGDNYRPSVIIPNKLDGQVIKKIGNNAFQANGLTAVRLPSGLTAIGDFAFQNNRISNVDLPAGLISIGEGAFEFN